MHSIAASARLSDSIIGSRFLAVCVTMSLCHMVANAAGAPSMRSSGRADTGRGGQARGRDEDATGGFPRRGQSVLEMPHRPRVGGAHTLLTCRAAGTPQAATQAMFHTLRQGADAMRGELRTARWPQKFHHPP